MAGFMQIPYINPHSKVRYLQCVLTMFPCLESASLQERSELAVAPPTGYLPSGEEEYQDLPGYSDGSFSLPGYGDDDLTRQAPAPEGEEDGENLSTTAQSETTTLTGEDATETTTSADG